MPPRTHLPVPASSIVSRVRAGESYNAVAASLGISPTTVRNVARAAGEQSRVKPGHGNTPWRENTALSRRKRK